MKNTDLARAEGATCAAESAFRGCLEAENVAAFGWPVPALCDLHKADRDRAAGAEQAAWEARARAPIPNDPGGLRGDQ